MTKTLFINLEALARAHEERVRPPYVNADELIAWLMEHGARAAHGDTLEDAGRAIAFAQIAVHVRKIQVRR